MSPVDSAVNQKGAQQWCSPCENPVRHPAADSSAGTHSEETMSATFIRVILVAESHQVHQWFNAGSLTTYLCRSSQIAAASKRFHQPLSIDQWQLYLSFTEEQQQQFLQQYQTLCVWGNEELISRTSRVQPLEADLRT